MVSIKEVAKRSGVAISTVSKVLNGYPGVSASTREKVNKVIDELGYVPNFAASMLSSKQGGRIAIIVNENTKTQAVDEIYIRYIQGANKEAREKRLDIVTIFYSMISELTIPELLNYLRSQNITGIIIAGYNTYCENFDVLIKSEEFKTVCIDVPFANENSSSVWIDNQKAQYDVLLKTVENVNCKTMLYIAGDEDGFITKERLAGARVFAEERNIDMKVRYGGFSELMARNITLEENGDADIIACASDLMAIGAMKTLIELDVFHPVCGFDGITLMGYVGKQMNTVRQDFSEIASRAVDELVRLMSGKPGRNVVLPYELVRMKYEDIIM